MKRFQFLTCLLLNATLPLFAEGSFTTQNPPQNETHHIVLNNRPLAKVHGKTFSLIDVVKKMDLFIQTNYPKVYEDKMALFQFYQGNWQGQLNEMIENELILTDAELKEVELSEGDIRQEMNERYGPNIFAKLDSLNLTLEEAKEIVSNELIVRQMLWYRAYSKAKQQVTPETIKQAYVMHLDQFNANDSWKYEVLTVRGDDDNAAQELATLASDILTGEKQFSNEGALIASTDENFALTQEKMDLKSLAVQLNEEAKAKDVKVVASASSDYNLESNKVSQEHLQVLTTLNEGDYSQPIEQITRRGTKVIRIFHLKDHQVSLPEKFDQFSTKAQDQLMNEEAGKEKECYIQKLKEKFYFTSDDQIFELPKNYEPFAFI
ncbi:MAG: hypothetical protein P0S95_04130 [Rhabdochlamydiaceae bacterium]|nr:hypothetical protein [Candidatus Amphrikana amoebophyrae]